MNTVKPESIESIVKKYSLEELHIKYNAQFDNYFIIALKQTQKGPAIGGTRFAPYNSLILAIEDAVRLSDGMYQKSSILNLAHGGGKGVITKPNRQYDRKELFKQYGKFVDELSGQYIAAVDYGTNPSDMDEASLSTSHIVCLSKHKNPAIYTAQGIFNAIESIATREQKNISDLSVCIQGLGAVGIRLAQLLINRSSTVYGTDISRESIQKAESIGVIIKNEKEIFTTQSDVFSPCATGGIINQNTIPTLNTKYICGAANNQLQDYEHDAQMLHDKGIIYCPDFVVNSGGLIYASSCCTPDNTQPIQAQLSTIANTLKIIIDYSKENNIPTYHSALKLIKENHDLSS